MDKEDEQSQQLDPNEDIYDANEVNRPPAYGGGNQNQQRGSPLNASRDPFNNEIQPDFFREGLNDRGTDNLRGGPYYEYEPEKTKNEEQ